MDTLVKATAWEGQIRVLTAVTTQLVGVLQERHHSFPVASAAMGRTATVTAIMGAMLKDEGSVTVQIKGDGPIGQIMADANAKGEVRAFVANPHVDLPLNSAGKLDVAKAIGAGMLYVVKDIGLGAPYRGSVPLVSGELGEDFSYYFLKSEQTPSSVGVGVLVNPDGSIRAAGGFLVQAMPGADLELLDSLTQRLQSLLPVSRMVEMGADAKALIVQVLGEEAPIRIQEEMPLRFACKCSRERVKRMLKGLGGKDLQEMIQQGSAEVTCHFCNEQYVLDQAELVQLYEEWRETVAGP